MAKRTSGKRSLWVVAVPVLVFVAMGCNHKIDGESLALETGDEDTGPAAPETIGGAGKEASMYVDKPDDRSHLVLPRIEYTGEYPLEKALFERRSVRKFKDRELNDEQLSRLLWAGQGISSKSGRRTAPSAGALYPLALHVLTAEGVFRYVPRTHALELLVGEDRRQELAEAALGQSWVSDGAASLVIGAAFKKTEKKYGARAQRYATLEAGAAAENILLESIALGLGAAFVGAFEDERVAQTAALPEGATPLAIVVVGIPKK